MKRQLQLLTIGLLLAAGGVNCAWAGDFIDDATKIEITNNSATTDVTSSVTTVDGKKQFSFTPSAAGEFQMKFTFSSGYTLNASQAFIVLEMSNNLVTDNNPNRKVRNLTIDNNSYEHNDKSNWATYTVKTDHSLAIFSPLPNSKTSSGASMRDYYIANLDNNMSLSFANIIVNASAATETTIYRVGMYSLGEMLSLYSDLCSEKDWQYISVATPRIEANGTNGNTIKIKDTAGGNATTDQAKLFVKTLGLSSMPTAYTEFNFRYLDTSDATTEDIFSSMTSTQKLLLSFDCMHKLPTLHSNFDQYDKNKKFYIYRDGTNPNTVTPTHESGDNWAIYTRNLKAGFNSIILPMKYLKYYNTDSLQFYKVGNYSSNTATFNKETPTSSGSNYYESPMIIHAKYAGLYTFVGRDGGKELSKYYEKQFGSTTIYYVGSNCEEQPMATGNNYANYVCYGITSDGASFAPMTSSIKTTYYRAFLVDKSGSSARALTLSFGDETTGIQNAMSESQQTDEVYDLQGRLVKTPTKGIYVKNGKKMIIK